MNKDKLMQTIDRDTALQYRPLRELIPKDWDKGRIDVGEAEIHYHRTGGDKPALLLVHGFQALGAYWLRTAQALQDRFDVVMVDLRGHGETGPTKVFDVETLATDLKAVIDALQLDRPALVGHSLGGGIVARLAADNPGLARTVVLVDPALSMPPMLANPDEAALAWQRSWLEDMRRFQQLPHEQRIASALERWPSGMQMWNEQDYVPIVEGQARIDLELIGGLNMAALIPDWPATVAAIDAPILLLTGDPAYGGGYDGVAVDAIEGAWDTGLLVHFPEAGHFLDRDRFDIVVELVREFAAEYGDGVTG